ncbi:hypothetical protein I4U23_005147 [Adineta vaga]|nr:hypothetical protein I4U23_005147 [Adineta vaga]
MDIHQNTLTINSEGILGMTGSYNSNSYAQLAAIQSSRTYFDSAHGSNSHYIMKIIIDLIHEIKKTERTFLVIHNDLPTNDWSSLFNILLEDKSYFGVANGRSFYEQCLPLNSVTLSHSSSSIHWLSRKPCEELEAFKTQAQLDYIQFLEHRSCELRPGGILILGIHCTDKHGESMVKYGYDLLYKCAQLLPLNDEELLDYTFPMHRRSYEECFNEEIFNRCSFQLITSDHRLSKSNIYEPYQQD